MAMHLIKRTDTSLATALIVGAIIVFHQPLRWLFDIAHDIERQFHMDLVPALAVLTVVFVFHEYRKRQDAKAHMLVVAADAAQARARSEELERLMTFGQALATALDAAALQQILCRALPAFVGERECWVLARHGERWEILLQDLMAQTRRSVDALEELAARTTQTLPIDDAQRRGCLVDTDVCFPLIAGGKIVGVLGTRNVPALTDGERHAVGAAATVAAIAVRNVQLLREAREHGVRDALTGCCNKAYGLEALQGELRRARRTSRPLSVLMFDIDHFKTINDEFGHLSGDAVLAEVGTQLTQVLRSTDVQCRYGGDEFLMILPDTPALGAQQVAEGLRRAIARVQTSGNTPISITASVGVTTAMPGELDVNAVVARADAALYSAKRAGRNRFCFAGGPAVVNVSGSSLVLSRGDSRESVSPLRRRS